jgi:pSer/pThr/pTyr-binding forkhead associated (FHA) protein
MLTTSAARRYLGAPLTSDGERRVSMAAMIVCTSCGKENAATFNFCLDCGNDLRRARTGPSLPAAGPPRAAPMPAAPPMVAPGPASPQPAPVLRPTPIPLTPGPSNAFVPAPSVMVSAPSPIPLTNAAPGTRTCPSCGATVPPGFAFCGSCGTRVASDAPPAEKGGTRFMSAVELAAPPAPRPRGKLTAIRADGGEGVSFDLGDSTETGRSQGAVLFADDPYVSPRHCRFVYEGERMHVEDSGSRNGVFRRIRGETQLGPGALVRVGRQLLRLETMPPDAPVAGDGTRAWGSPNPGYLARLVQVLEGGAAGEAYPLKGGDNLIGRETGDITFPQDGFVSGRHASIVAAPDSVRVRDLGSSNGTFVRVDGRAALESGDYLLIGNQLLRVDMR